jgi:uracil-DNA glycosylase family 4
MQEWESELAQIVNMLKVKVNLLQETGMTYLSNAPDKTASISNINSDNNGSLEELKKSLNNCQKCKLGGCRTNIVFGSGHAQARLVFVGEAPGKDEDLSGEPFVGRAGQLLTKMIIAMGLSREQVYICNVVKCRPPENRDPEADEIASCEPFLKQQLALIKPEIIVGLGRYACQTLLQTKIPMSQIRGIWHHYEGISFMPTFHPAYLLRNPPAKKEVWQDLQQVMTKLGLPVSA